MEYITALDIALTPVYIFIVYLFARSTRAKHRDNPAYKHYIPGLMVKIGGAMALGLVYALYYKGQGDTFGYFNSSVCLVKLLYKNPSAYLSILLGDLSGANHALFDMSTGWPWYWTKPETFAVVRFISPFTLLGMQQYFPTSVLIATLNHTGTWRLYRMLTELYPKVRGRLAIAVLYMPSVFFWGSGILKDSLTLTAAGWLTYSIYQVFVKKRSVYRYGISSIIATYVLITIKPYIFFTIAAAYLFWITSIQLKRIKSAFIKVVILPILLLIVWGGGALVFLQMSTVVGGEYSSMDALMEKAVETQSDLKRDYYGENSFDIGQLEPTLPSMLSKSPQAIMAGLYRPYIWEANNIVMMFSGLENMFLLLMTLYLIFRAGPVRIVSIIFNEPMVMFSIVFVTTLGFVVGITTANFGALVRYKIPLIPFLMTAIFLIFNKIKRPETEEAQEDELEKENHPPQKDEEDGFKPMFSR